MAIALDTDQITADDETIRKALHDAFLPALIPALAQATGDLSILREDIRPPGFAPGVPQGGMTVEQQAAARIVAFEALRTLRDRATSTPDATESDLRTITQWMTGSAAPDDYIPLLVEELAPFDEDTRAPAWRMDSGIQFSVAIIGAGMSGILAGIRLKQAGVPF